MKVVKLKNVYTGEIVLCADINEISEGEGKRFILVFREEHPERTFWVNFDAFKIINN